MALMFNKIRSRLLLSYLLILASILSIFALGVRLIFAHSLKEQTIANLRALGNGATANAEWENNQLKIDNDFRLQDLDKNHQSLEWFDQQGNSILKQGNFVMSLPFSSTDLIQTQNGNPKIQGVTLPVIDSDLDRLIGYVRVSQSLKDSEETLNKLDRGLTISIILAVITSGIGGIILTNQAMKPIEESFLRLKQFTADASHELRNPLMVIDSNVTVSLKYPDGMRDSDRESFDAIASATEQMTRLTEDLLLLARSDTLKPLIKEKIDLAIILKNLVQQYQVKLREKKIHLNLELDPFLLVLGDTLKLERLLKNLIDNAIYYTPILGIIYIRGKKHKSSIEIEIRDTGIGIAPENIEKIFERFWRGDTSRSHWSGGSGLGLSIVKSIVTEHKGTITVNSQLKKGTCFTIFLPIH